MFKRLRLQSAWWFSESAARWGRQFVLGAVVGILAGFAAVGLHDGLEYGVTHVIGRFAAPERFGILHFHWAIVLLPCVGGLAGGLFVWLLNPGDPRQGTNLVVESFHRRGGNLGLRGPLTKAVAAVGVISAGGSAGPEGPIAALGAAIGSSLSRRLGLSPRDCRVLLVAGCAGGVGAVFQCPLGGALFAASVLYREPEIEANSIVPAFVSSVVSYSVFMLSPGFGHRMLEGADGLAFTTPWELLPYALLALVCSLLSIMFCTALRLVESRPLRRFRLPPWSAPALGGLLVGVLGCLLPQVMDAQYHFTQLVLDAFSGRERLPLSWGHACLLFGAVAACKCLATALTVGSGAPGGVLGPSVFIGGAGGAFVAALVEALAPGWFPPGLAPSLIPVGMAGMLAATMRTPMAALVMVTEMTGSYGLVVPLMFVTVTAYVLGRRWALNPAQVRTSAESPAHAGDLLISLLESIRVRELMDRNWPRVVSPSTTLGEMIRGLPPVSRPVFAVVENGRLVGIVSLPEIGRVFAQPEFLRIMIATDVMVERFPALRPHDRVYSALERFRGSRYDVLPVVSDDGEGRFLGMLRRQAVHDLVRSRTAEMRDHLHREHSGFSALEQDEQLYQLGLGLAAPNRDVLRRIPVPTEAVGRSLREADFRRSFGSVVLGIQRSDGSLQCPPDIDVPLAADQSLLVISMGASDPDVSALANA